MLQLTWRWFPAAAAVAAGLLLKMGAPLLPIAAGLVVAAAVTWQMRRGGSR